MREVEMGTDKLIFKIVAAGLSLTIVASVFSGSAAAGEADVQPTRGRFMGHTWHIDEHHLQWWDGQPYVRYGFTGNGDVERFMKLGFDQFHAYPSEALWVFSDDPEENREAIRQVDEFTARLVQKGATYYAGLNSLWPWRQSDKITPGDFVGCVYKRAWNVSEFAGTNRPITVAFAAEQGVELERQNTKLYLFDLAAGTYRDISAKLRDIETETEQVRESASERYTVTRHTLTLDRFPLPTSEDLRLTLIVKIKRPMVPGVYPSGFPALWKPGIMNYFTAGLRSFKTAYAKEGLRGMMFGDEINTHRNSLLYSQMYVDFRDDKVALASYRNWLKKKFETIQELNEFLDTDFEDFEAVTWRICIYPFLEDEADGFERSFMGNTFGLFASAEQLEKIDRLQEEFRVWFYGYWLAKYAKMAKEIIGDVPVFLTSAGMGGDAESYLQIHKHAMLQGMDGLVRNHYAWVGTRANGRLATFAAGSDIRFPLETVTQLLDEVQRQSGKTKTYFANEFGRPRAGDDNFVDDFGLGNQFSFTSKKELRDFLTVLINNGCKGFNMFKMNPNVEAAQKEVKWLAELKDEIVEQTVRTTSYEKQVRISKERAIAAARQHPEFKQLLEEHPQARASAAFNERYNVWIIEFIEDDKEIGFASVSEDGRVLETEARHRNDDR
jgi:hypothetical protein